MKLNHVNFNDNTLRNAYNRFNSIFFKERVIVLISRILSLDIAQQSYVGIFIIYINDEASLGRCVLAVEMHHYGTCALNRN